MDRIKNLWTIIFPYPLLIFLIVAFISWQNYTPGTILSGWDTLHPEFNFSLAFSRMFNGVWRADQGLGTVAAHSHMADLPRVLVLWVASAIFPTDLLRYLGIFTCLLMGPLGVYFLTKQLLAFTHRNTLIAFASALTYLMNLGTVQHFVVPFEMFTVAYGVLPWLYFNTFAYLTHPSKRHFLYFAITVIALSPSAYAATLWYALFITFTLGLLIMVKRHSIRHIAILLATMIIVNLYWITPNIYYAVNHGTDVKNAKVNRLFNPEAFAKNQEFGTIADTVILKNHLFDWAVYDFKRLRTVGLLDTWKSRGNIFTIETIGFLATPMLAFIGLLSIFTHTRRRRDLVIPISGIACFLVILNGTWPISELFTIIATLSPLTGEALRFPFTKFSIPLMLAISVLSGYGLLRVMTIIKHWRFGVLGIVSIYISLLGVSFYPAYAGNLIHQAMRITYPEAYEQMFSWFRRQPADARVAILPINTFWNWTYTAWGYQGAGFLQFGIPQPIMDRDYDRWNPANEQYTREMSYAIYNQDPELLAQVLRKFAVSYIVFDPSVISPGSPESALLKSLTPDILLTVPGVTVAARFGDITVFRVEHDTGPTLLTGVTSVGPRLTGAPYDVTFGKLGNYFWNPIINTIFDPTRSMFTADERFLGQALDEPVATISAQTTDKFVSLLQCNLKLPSPISGREITNGVIRYVTQDGPLCDYISLPDLDHAQGYVIEFVSRNVLGFPLQIAISNDMSRHNDVAEHLGKHTEFTPERFFIPPLADWGRGYTINFNNFTIKGMGSVNELQSITVTPIDPSFFMGVYPATPSASTSTPIASSHPNLSTYVLTFPPDATLSGVLSIPESFEQGWTVWNVTLDPCKENDLKCRISNSLKKMFPFFFGKEITNHVLVNNWANAWTISNDHQSTIQQFNNQTIVIFFLPQLLEWFGLALIPPIFIFMFYMKRQNR
jgi:hypothetical protein